MAILSESEAKNIINKVLSYAKADETSVTIVSERTGNIRYARNTVSTSGEKADLSFVVTTVFGKRSGIASGNEFSDEAIKKVVKAAEETAALAPENPEWMSVLGPQQYQPSGMYIENTAAVTADARAQAALQSIQPCVANNLVAAGYLEDSTIVVAIGNSKGLFGYNKTTDVNFSVTVRTKDDKGSGVASQDTRDILLLNTKAATAIAMQKAVASANAVEMPPGKYTVILEPLGLAGFVPFFMGALDARNADEGRSFFSKKGGGTKVGDKLFSEQLSIYSDPWHESLPSAPFVEDGRPAERVNWVEKGVVKNLSYSRYWADKKGVKAVAASQAIILEGGTASLADMIKESDKTILITTTHYMRLVDPQTIMITGLTRDGLFYIENGVIKNAVKNFRFNESPINMFSNLQVLGKPSRVGNSLIPPMKVANFNFTSVSDAV